MKNFSPLESSNSVRPQGAVMRNTGGASGTRALKANDRLRAAAVEVADFTPDCFMRLLDAGMFDFDAIDTQPHGLCAFEVCRQDFVGDGRSDASLTVGCTGRWLQRIAKKWLGHKANFGAG